MAGYLATSYIGTLCLRHHITTTPGSECIDPCEGIVTLYSDNTLYAQYAIIHTPPHTHTHKLNNRSRVGCFVTLLIYPNNTIMPTPIKCGLGNTIPTYLPLHLPQLEYYTLQPFKAYLVSISSCG